METWEVTTQVVPVASLDSYVPMPDGWEPFGVVQKGENVVVLLRRRSTGT